MEVLFERAPAALLTSGLVALLAQRRGSLTVGGAFTGFVLGSAIFLAGGLPYFAALLVFFVTSSALGKVGAARKRATKREFSKDDTRDSRQVLANGGVAALCAVAFGASSEPIWAAGYLGALATATGDTWATEIGTLSRGRPRSIVTLQRVPRGTSGAVSRLGLLATIAGAALIGLVAAAVPEAFALQAGAAFAAAAVGGTLGACADSAFGAVLQSRFRCATCNVVTEGERHYCGSRTIHCGGVRWLDNDAVNAGATLLGGCAAMALQRLL